MYQIGSRGKNIIKIIERKTVELAEASYAIDNMGLYSGKTGILLSLHHLVNNFKINSPLVREAIKCLQKDISENAGDTDDSFSDGIFGIGWAVSTLYEQGYINENETEVVNSFDDELYKLVMYQKSATHDLETGTMGRISYYLKRISEELKISNKYRYVCNYECLMLLVDDFTNENENIIKQLQSDAQGLQLLMNDGRYYGTVFNLLSILVEKNIHLEITGRQQLQFLKIFYNHFNYIRSNQELFHEYKIYLNTISILNCLLTLSAESKSLKEYLSLDYLFRPQIISGFSHLYEDVRDIITQLSFYRLNKFEIPENILENIAANYCNIKNKEVGLNGLSGSLYLLSAFKHKKLNTIKEAFLL